LIAATGRFDLDLLAFVQHPAAFDIETGELVPHVHPGCGGEGARARHAQHYFRLYNKHDGIYRTLLFAKERGREVRIEAAGESGIKVITPEYTDYVWLGNEVVTARWTAPSVARSGVAGDGDAHLEEVRFTGRAGWIRREASGQVRAVVPDGERLGAFGVGIEGRGPWSYNLQNDGKVALHAGPPRQVAAAIRS
jgi:hypothetical protein